MQAVFIVVSAWLGAAVGADAPLWAWFIAWPLAKAAGMLPVSLGGLGVRDAALASLLVPFGVPAAVGLVASLAWQAVLIGGALVGGLLGLVLRPARDPVSSPPIANVLS
jgi:glycosyltransferase 2 family protein